MITAISIHEQTSKLIKKDGRSGYFSFDEFNQWTPIVESTLMSYYCQILEDTSEVVDSLQPFLDEKRLVLSPSQNINKTGYTSFPSDYRRYVDMGYELHINSSNCGGEATKKTISCDYCHTKEWFDMFDSVIRRPSAVNKGTVRYRIINQTFEVSEPNGVIDLVYIKNPIYANIAYTVNSSNDEQVQNVNSTLNFQWLEKDRTNLIDLFCMYLGMSIRETPLIQWAQMQKK